MLDDLPKLDALDGTVIVATASVDTGEPNEWVVLRFNEGEVEERSVLDHDGGQWPRFEPLPDGYEPSVVYDLRLVVPEETLTAVSADPKAAIAERFIDISGDPGFFIRYMRAIADLLSHLEE